MRRYLPGIIIAIVIFVLQLFALPHAGMTWDEPSVFFVGRANVKFWTSFDRRYLEEMGSAEVYDDNPMYYMYGAQYYPPFSYTIGGFMSAFFGETLGLVDVITGHHLGGLVIAVFGIAAFYGIAVNVGLPATIAGITTIVYALYPTIVGQMRNDAKDVPLMSMIVVSTFVFLKFIHSWKTSRWRKRIVLASATGILLGFAAAIKPTAYTILVAWTGWLLFAIHDSKELYRRLRPARIIIVFIPIIFAFSIASFVFIWPWLWTDPVGHIMEAWDFFREVGYHMPVPYFGRMYRAGISVPLHYTFGVLVIQTPILITLLALVGAGYAIHEGRKDNPYPLFFVIWFILPLSRFWIDGVVIYAKIRQFIEVIPAFIMLVGFGLITVSRGTEVVFRRIKKKHIPAWVNKERVAAFVGGLVIVHEIVIVGMFFPYEPSYFNFLIGGTQMVSEKHLFDVEYWGSGIKEALDWIEEREEGGEVRVYACLMRHLAINYAGPNTTIVGLAEPAKYTIVPNSHSWFGGTTKFLTEMETLAHVVARSGIPLFYVYENTSGLIWRCGWESSITEKHS